MSNDAVDTSKRRFLVALTSAAGAVGAVGFVYPFVASMNPSARAEAAGAPVEVDISKLQPGELIVVEYRKKPVWILSRTEQNMSDLPKLDPRLADPHSNASIQPVYCKNEDRSRESHKNILVAIGICTHLGCSPKYRPEMGPDDLGSDWVGGFYCPCHGSRFDLAGRVFKGVPAPTNLTIPKYKYVNATTIKVGEDSEGAA